MINPYIKLKKTGSCMLENIDGLSHGYDYSAKDSMLGFVQKRKGAGSGFLTFCGPVEEDYASNFASYIRRHRLGRVWATAPMENGYYHPEGRPSQVFVWHPDDKALLRWWAKNKPAGAKDPVRKNRWL